MRICPTCRTQYTDDTLLYCLQDGATLVEQLESETPTVAFREPETIKASRQTASPSVVTTQELTQAATAKKSGGPSGLLVALIAVIGVLVIIVIVGAIGLAVYLNEGTTASNSNNANVNANGGLFGISGNHSPTPFPYPSNVSRSTPPPTPAVDIDRDRVRQEVSQSIYGWKSMAEARDLDAYMGNYADTVDYYTKPGASRSFVRGDKSRAFTMYDSIHTNISNMSITLDESGERATATFDKEWDFRGSRTSSGKVQSQLKLRNVNGRWLIVSERDLRVYYTR